MKTTTTADEIKAIILALNAIHVRPYDCQSAYPKYNAQRNLRGKTHYVDDDTLRWHKSRVLDAHTLHAGLLFRIVCCDSLDMHNTKRGFRAVVFDVFGTTIDRPKLEEASSTQQGALKLSDASTIDLVSHYREAIADQLNQSQNHAEALRDCLGALPVQNVKEAA